MSAPNLDGMSQSELMDIWKATNSVRPIKQAREWFPDQPEGYVRAAKELGLYASNKATAMGCRKMGSIQAALVYERIADSIYERLPFYARW